MSKRPAEPNPALEAAVLRAREALEVAGPLKRPPTGFRSSLGPRERAAVARILRDGTYRRLADAVAHDDPELADL